MPIYIEYTVYNIDKHETSTNP